MGVSKIQTDKQKILPYILFFPSDIPCSTLVFSQSFQYKFRTLRPLDLTHSEDSLCVACAVDISRPTGILCEVQREHSRIINVLICIAECRRNSQNWKPNRLGIMAFEDCLMVGSSKRIFRKYSDIFLSEKLICVVRICCSVRGNFL